jgi:2-phosphosulfolactate phosphatase
LKTRLKAHKEENLPARQHRRNKKRRNMDICILHGIAGARNARGLAVVIDVFRAFTTACYAYGGGAASIIPVARAERAYELRRQNPGYLLMGERDTVMLPGFDFGNSPADIRKAGVNGKTIVHTTSAGTQGLAAAEAVAEEVITGSFANARAIARYVQAQNPERVSLVAMGTSGLEPSDEDTLCAEYLDGLMRGENPDFAPIREHLRGIQSAAKFFDPAATQAPEEDFELCTALDAFDFVLRCQRDGQGIRRLVKISPSPVDDV